LRAELERQLQDPPAYLALTYNCVWWSAIVLNHGVGARPAEEAGLCAAPCTCELDGQVYGLSPNGTIHVSGPNGAGRPVAFPPEKPPARPPASTPPGFDTCLGNSDCPTTGGTITIVPAK
jgi:hypothetical protein